MKALDVSNILLSPPHLSGDEIESLREAVASNWIAPVGPDLDAFERELAARTGVSFAAAVSSGTAALHLALLGVGVRPGDEVLCSTFTFIASANAIVHCGATPIFIDASVDSWNIDVDLYADELRERARRNRIPRAAVVVDGYGKCADFDSILAISREYGVKVIEDAAEALGSSYNGRPAGSLGDVGVLSFNGNKIITCSSGGALLSNDPDQIEHARFLATQARDPARHYEHSVVGFNYRLSNLLAALGRAQLRHLDDRVAARRSVNSAYRERLENTPGIRFAPWSADGESNCWLSCITIDAAAFGADRDAVIGHLENHQIEARPVWKPLHGQPAYADAPYCGGSVSEHLFQVGLCLPSGSSLSAKDLERVSSVLLETPRS